MFEVGKIVFSGCLILDMPAVSINSVKICVHK